MSYTHGPAHEVRRTRWVIVPLLALTALLFVFLAARPALAGGADPGVVRGAGGEDVQVVVVGRAEVLEEETFDDIVVVSGAVTVDGTVRGNVVVFDRGPVRVNGTVGGDVVVFEAPVVLGPDARVGGDLVTSRAPVLEDGAVVDGATRRTSGDFGVVEPVARAAFYVFSWLVWSVASLLLALLVVLVAPRAPRALVAVAGERPGVAAGVGVLTVLLLPALVVLLLVTVLALPLGLLLLGALPLLYALGYAVAVWALGRLLVRPPRSWFLALLAGWAIARAVALVPFLGAFSEFVGVVFGLGLLVVAAFRARSGHPGMLAPAGAGPTSGPEPGERPGTGSASGAGGGGATRTQAGPEPGSAAERRP